MSDTTIEFLLPLLTEAETVITAESLLQHTQILASEEFEGEI
jgi:hypothetical protein